MSSGFALIHLNMIIHIDLPERKVINMQLCICLRAAKRSPEITPDSYMMHWRQVNMDIPSQPRTVETGTANVTLNLSPKMFTKLSHANMVVKNVHGNGKSVYDTTRVTAVESHVPLLCVSGK